MKNKLIYSLSGFLIVTLLFGFYFAQSAPPKVIDLKVVKVKGVWRVVDATDYTKFQVKVKKKDKIVWTIEGTDASFQFPTNLFDADTPVDSLNNGYTKLVKNGKKLRLKVKADALSGTYEYAVFCTADGVFAQGGSPPRIVIE